MNADERKKQIKWRILYRSIGFIRVNQCPRLPAGIRGYTLFFKMPT
jgi:hypothetical protein